ncbi:MAG: response regulator transcription factor [Nitrospinota bacterium]|nr:response regulator transcription factor [Nitrospinota bacterium]
MARTILVVDDDPHIREVITFALEQAGMTPVEAMNGQKALDIVHQESPALIILDINMPEVDGFQFCREIRKTSEVPILFLSSRDEEIDRVVGLEIGGDDYVSKPFSPRELIARVNAILKRVQAAQKPIDNKSSQVLKYGLLTLEPEKHRIRWNQNNVELTAREFAILKAFLTHPEIVFDRDRIIEHACETNSFISDRTVDSHIRHIRGKFSELGCTSVIETVHGVGYKLGTCR